MDKMSELLTTPKAKEATSSVMPEEIAEPTSVPQSQFSLQGLAGVRAESLSKPEPFLLQANYTVQARWGND